MHPKFGFNSDSSPENNNLNLMTFASVYVKEYLNSIYGWISILIEKYSMEQIDPTKVSRSKIVIVLKSKRWTWWHTYTKATILDPKIDNN